MECDKELPYTHAHNKIELLYSIYLIPHYYRIVEICNQKWLGNCMFLFDFSFSYALYGYLYHLIYSEVASLS